MKKASLLFGMGFSTAFLLVVNVVFAANRNYLGVFVFLFLAYLFRGLAVKDLNSKKINSFIFACGASLGGVSGLYFQENIVPILFG